MASSSTRFLDHTQRRTTVGRIPLDEWSSRRRDFYLTTHNNTKQTNIHATGGIRTHDRSRRADVDLHFRPRGHWDRPALYFIVDKFNSLCPYYRLLKANTRNCRTASLSLLHRLWTIKWRRIRWAGPVVGNRTIISTYSTKTLRGRHALKDRKVAVDNIKINLSWRSLRGMGWNFPIQHISCRISLLGIWNPAGKRRFEQSRRRWTVLTWILSKLKNMMSNGFILIGGFLWTRYTFGLHQRHEFLD
jgi:hypothetical protein